MLYDVQKRKCDEKYKEIATDRRKKNMKKASEKRGTANQI